MSDILTSVEAMQPVDWDTVIAIYKEGIATGNATLETSIPTWEAWDNAHLPFCRLVSRRDGVIAGWAALTKASGRCVYEGVAEISVYVAEKFRGQGVGKELLNALVAESEQNGIWTLQAGIIKENHGSIILHHACGFRVIGIREKLGKLNGAWRDVVLLERRSAVVGV